jgi:hypothetical protein
MALQSDLVSIVKSLFSGVKNVLDCERKQIDLNKTTDFIESFLRTKKFNIQFSDYVRPGDKVSKYFTDKRFFYLATYWSLWANIAYYDIPTITNFVASSHLSSKKQIKFYNTSMGGEIGKPFFFLAVDHLSRSIVIAIRGSSNVSDGLTDALGLLVSFIPDDPQARAHSGFVTAARNVINNVMNDLTEYSQQYPFYPIKVVGHSYGAATSSLVAYILNNIFKVKSDRMVRAIVYCCPPTFNEYCANKICVTGFVVTFIMGWDAVARASLSNAANFVCTKPQAVEVAHVPGKIFWITYNNDSSLGEIYLIASDFECLQNMFLHPYMVEDHSMSKMIAALIVLSTKNYVS